MQLPRRLSIGNKHVFCSRCVYYPRIRILHAKHFFSSMKRRTKKPVIFKGTAVSAITLHKKYAYDFYMYRREPCLLDHLCMVAYFCHLTRSLVCQVAFLCHLLSDLYVDLSVIYVDLSDHYVDLSDHYVDLSDHYVDLSENYHHNQSLNILF